MQAAAGAHVAGRREQNVSADEGGKAAGRAVHVLLEPPILLHVVLFACHVVFVVSFVPRCVVPFVPRLPIGLPRRRWLRILQGPVDTAVTLSTPHARPWPISNKLMASECTGMGVLYRQLSSRLCHERNTKD